MFGKGKSMALVRRSNLFIHMILGFLLSFYFLDVVVVLMVFAVVQTSDRGQIA